MKVNKGFKICPVCNKKFFSYHITSRKTCSDFCKKKYLSNLFSTHKYYKKFLYYARLGGKIRDRRSAKRKVKVSKR